jgi:hypothetical protein
MKKTLTVSSEDTCVSSLARILNEEQIQALLVELQNLNKVCIPQSYTNDEHAQYYGFKNLKDMNAKCYRYKVYEDVDQLMNRIL